MRPDISISRKKTLFFKNKNSFEILWEKKLKKISVLGSKFISLFMQI